MKKKRKNYRKSWERAISQQEYTLRTFNEDNSYYVPLGNNPHIDFDGVLRFGP